MKTAKKRGFIIAGSLLAISSGGFLVFGSVLSWAPPWADFNVFVTFILHPITWLFFLGLWLLYTGLTSEAASK
jgi:hypothetical protein